MTPPNLTRATPMTAKSATRLLRGIRRASEAAGWKPQPTGRGWSLLEEPQPAWIRRDSWRHWWVLSETAQMAEGSDWTGIYWDVPSKPIVLHYTRDWPIELLRQPPALVL